jgi:transposase
MSRDRDFRKLPANVQAELRRTAVAMVDGGAKYKVAADAVGVSVRFIGKWIDARRNQGDAGLDGGRRGRRPGEQQVLEPKVAERIRRKIADKCPDQLKLPFALWTREAVRDLILKETGIRLSLQAVSNYLARWNMTPQRPAKRAKEQNAAAVQQWLDRDYPALVRRAKREKAEIQWADETGVSNQANYGRSFAPRGKTPVVTRTAIRFTESMISSVTNQGKLRFMIYSGALNVAIFLKFLQRLVRDATRKVILIVDNLRVHRAKVVMAWAVANKAKIELVFLPPYAPQHNPDEYLNNDVKQALARRATPKDKAAMKGALTSYMRGLQKRPSKVKSFFQAPTVRYAA